MANYKIMLKSALAVGLASLAYDQITYGAFSQPIDSPSAIVRKVSEPIDVAIEGFVKPLAQYQVAPSEPASKTAPGLISLAGLAGLVLGATRKRKENEE